MSYTSDLLRSPWRVPGCGPIPADVMAIGEAPGEREHADGRPFVGPSGRLQSRLFGQFGLGEWYHSKVRLNNVVQTYHPGNPDPSPEDIATWTPILLDEIRRCNPKLIITLGRFAANFFLGDGLDMEDIHGLPHKPGCLDPSRTNRAPAGCTILPFYHPAAGLRRESFLPYILWDYSQTPHVWNAVRSNTIDYREDPLRGKERYSLVTGKELALILRSRRPDIIGIDTEGTPDDPWSIQVATAHGESYVVLTRDLTFAEAVAALQELVDAGCIVCVHQASGKTLSFYDISMCRIMGLELRHARLWDSMYKAYLLASEPQGLKPLSWRWNGVKMAHYEDLIEGLGLPLQLDYLRKVVSYPWNPPQMRIVMKGDGTYKKKTPKRIALLAANIIQDVESGKVTEEGPTKPVARWKKVDLIQRKWVEDVFGKMPQATLDLVPIDDAVAYAAGDSDNTLRLNPNLGRSASYDLWQS